MSWIPRVQGIDLILIVSVKLCYARMKYTFYRDTRIVQASKSDFALNWTSTKLVGWEFGKSCEVMLIRIGNGRIFLFISLCDE